MNKGHVYYACCIFNWEKQKVCENTGVDDRELEQPGDMQRVKANRNFQEKKYKPVFELAIFLLFLIEG